MKTFDELVVLSRREQKAHTEELIRMNEAARLAYLNEQVEKVIENANPRNVLKLRALQARLDKTRVRVKNPQVRLEMIYNEMIDSLHELNDALRGVTR